MDRWTILKEWMRLDDLLYDTKMQIDLTDSDVLEETCTDISRQLAELEDANPWLPPVLCTLDDED